LDCRHRYVNGRSAVQGYESNNNPGGSNRIDKGQGMSATDQPYSKQEALMLRNVQRVRELREMLQHRKAEKDVQEQP
jgi:hypothetical protein